MTPTFCLLLHSKWQNFTDLHRFVFMGLAKKSIVFSSLLFSGGQVINQSIHMNIFFAQRMFREMRYRPYCFVIHHLFIAKQSTKFITSFYYIYTKMDNKMKERNCVDKYRSKCKKKRRGFHGYKAENVTTTTTQSESMHMQDGEEPILEFCGKNREMICCRRCRKFKDN